MNILSLDYFPIAITILAELVSVILGIRLCKSRPSSTLLFFTIYLVTEFLRSSVGSILARVSIHNISFYLLSEFFSLFAFIFFAYNLLQYKIRKRTTQMLGLIGIIYFTIALIYNQHHTLIFQFKIPIIIEIILSILILNSRVVHTDGLRFHQDFWSIISFTLTCTLSISMLSIVARQTAVDCNLPTSYYHFFVYLNCISVFFRFVIISRYLNRAAHIRTYSLKPSLTK